MIHKALIGIGSNLDLPAENCLKAISILSKSKEVRVASQSSLYESEPIGNPDQPWFVNAAVEIQTNLNPEELLQYLLNIENQLGRIRKEKWGPRIIDLDILDYEGQIINSSTLTLPHPEMAQRRFVLEPLSEIAGATIHPLKNKTIADLLKEQPNFPIVKKYSPHK